MRAGRRMEVIRGVLEECVRVVGWGGDGLERVWERWEGLEREVGEHSRANLVRWKREQGSGRDC